MNWIKCSERQPSKSGGYLVTALGMDYLTNKLYYFVDYISYYTGRPFGDEDKSYYGWQTTSDVVAVVAWNDEELEPYKPPTGLQTVEVYIEGVEDDVEVFSKINTAITKAVEEEGYTVGALTSSWKEGGDK